MKVKFTRYMFSQYRQTVNLCIKIIFNVTHKKIINEEKQKCEYDGLRNITIPYSCLVIAILLYTTSILI